MWAKGLLALGLLAGNSLIAGGLELCIENPARLDEFTVQAFRGEIQRIAQLSNRPIAFAGCRSGHVRIVLRNEPPDEETSALGAIRQQDGRLLPEIELFVSSTSRLINTRLSGILGRALARVATHELGHLLTRRATHRDNGVMMERLSAAHLMASDRNFFSLPPGE
jgi:hypothetical protein